MAAKDDVIEIIDKLELEEYFVIRGVETVTYECKRAVAVIVEVREE